MTPSPQASQSALSAASDGAERIGDLTMVMIVGVTLVFAFVMLLLARAVRNGPRAVNQKRWLVGGGLLLPGVVLSALLVEGIRVSAALSHDPEAKGLEVEVIARRWWWELRYQDAQGRGKVVLANELHLPLDCNAVLTLDSHDVIHSFWVPALAGKMDVVPGRRNRVMIHASKPGRFRGQCAEYCGTQHANMGIEVVVESPEEFRTWLLNQAQPAIEPSDPTAVRGRQVFLDAGCAACHAIRGTVASGVLGPDLTHVASRRKIASATLANDAQSLLAWIHGAQQLKPGGLMPSTTTLQQADLSALGAYLGSLH